MANEAGTRLRPDARIAKEYAWPKSVPCPSMPGPRVCRPTNAAGAKSAPGPSVHLAEARTWPTRRLLRERAPAHARGKRKRQNGAVAAGLGDARTARGSRAPPANCLWLGPWRGLGQRGANARGGKLARGGRRRPNATAHAPAGYAQGHAVLLAKRARVARSTSIPNPGACGIVTSPEACSIGALRIAWRKGCSERSNSNRGSIGVCRGGL